MILGLLRAADIAVIAVAGLIAYELRHEEIRLPGNYVLAVAACCLITAQIFHLGGIYRFQLLDQVLGQCAKLLTLWAAVGLSLIAIGFFSKTSEDYSRIWVGLWLAFSFLGFCGVRIAVKLQLGRWRRAGQLTRKLVIVGATERARRLVAHLQGHAAGSVTLLGIFDDRDDSRVPREILGCPMLGTLDDLTLYVRRHQIDQVVVTLPWNAEERLMQIMARLRTLPVDVQLCPDGIGFQLAERGVTYLAGMPLLTVYDRPLTGWSYVVKSLEDRLLAALFLVLFSPLLAVLAVAVKLSSPGPVLFRQQRYGFNNNVFTLYKFRTMYHGRPPEPGTPQARRDDPRVTPLGRFLRRTSLDELPQLLNVLSGDMSIVGPRPHAVEHNEAYAKIISQYLGRHRVKPGITGWAQVHGLRGETDTPDKMAKRVQYDLYYIDNWSLALDLKIIARTLLVGFRHENAY